MEHEHFGPVALAALERAVQEARRTGHRIVGLPHLLLALSEPPGGAAARALERLGVDRVALRAALQRRLAPPRTAFAGVPEPSARLQRLLQTVDAESAAAALP
ncbi:MAG: hypothetical protein HYU88_13625, partial [Chloroflexi bacterium]|nr:hypothetical protein [Chloroflexota bacterium]